VSGHVGLQGDVYQTYELIPHRLNQFVSATYRHTSRNNFGYQFGDQYDRNVDFNLVTMPWLVLAIGDRTQIYFFSQIPVARDFNNNLAQGISFVFGITQYFQGRPCSKDRLVFLALDVENKNLFKIVSGIMTISNF
jgi:hypothetical protein